MQNAMTALPLLAWICGALLLQTSIAIVAAVRRHRRASSALAASDPPLDDTPQSAAAWPGWRSFRVAGRKFEDTSHAQCSLVLLPVDGATLPLFIPGQYLTLRLMLDDPRRAGALHAIVRCYSLSAPSTTTGYRITVKRALRPVGLPDVPPGAASTHLLDSVRVGDCFDVRAPAGRFSLDPDPAASLVLDRRRDRHHAAPVHAEIVGIDTAGAGHASLLRGCAMAASTRSARSWPGSPSAIRTSRRSSPTAAPAPMTFPGAISSTLAVWTSHSSSGRSRRGGIGSTSADPQR